MRLWQVACFAAGWLVLFGALVAPLHWLGERLFAAHMIEHDALMAVAAPLISVDSSGAITITDNAGLCDSDAQAFVDAQTAAGWAGVATLSGNQVCP